MCTPLPLFFKEEEAERPRGKKVSDSCVYELNGPQSCDSVSVHCHGIQGEDNDKFFNLTGCDILDDKHVIAFLQVAWIESLEQYPLGIKLLPISMWHRLCVCVCVCVTTCSCSRVCVPPCTHEQTHSHARTCTHMPSHALTSSHMHTHAHSEAAKFHILQLSVVLDLGVV